MKLLSLFRRRRNHTKDPYGDGGGVFMPAAEWEAQKVREREWLDQLTPEKLGELT